MCIKKKQKYVTRAQRSDRAAPTFFVGVGEGRATKEGEKSSEITWDFKGDEVIHTYKVVGTDVASIQTFKKK